jgi:hypothetical protein
VERNQVSTGDVPVWAWTNVLAHGSEEDLRAESAAVCRGGTYGWRWRQARSYLAGEVLHCAQLHGSLAEVQRTVLAPLELKLASMPEVTCWTPARWAMTVETALTEASTVPRDTHRTNGAAPWHSSALPTYPKAVWQLDKAMKPVVLPQDLPGPPPRTGAALHGRERLRVYRVSTHGYVPKRP